MTEARIAEYDPDWPTQAETWLRRIAEATAPLTGSANFAFEHIGSTSVPGLAAKPIIDLQMLSAALPDEKVLTDALASIGLERARGSRPDSPGVYFDIPRPGTDSDPALHAKLLFHTSTQTVILHVRRADSPFAAYVLAFRDWLRADAANAGRYEHVKRELSAKFAGSADYDDYTLAKSSFLDEVQREIGWS